MKKALFPLLVLVMCLTILLSYMSIVDFSKAKSDTEYKQNENKNEYIYKEELLNLGYNIKEINTIENKISNLIVKEYLLNKKYDHLIEFISSPYFKIDNIDRYEKYYENNPNFSTDEVVIYVQIGLDIPFYTEVKEIEDYKKITTLINKYNKLKEEPVFDDLVVIEKKYGKPKKLRRVAYEAIKKMIDDAKKDGVNLYIVSGYRSMSEQNYLFNNSKKRNGIEHALIYSAKSGHSEHQLGLAVDLNQTIEEFENTKEYAWLRMNAYKYGFIQRYPKNKEFITGYAYEPWHYRYLGVEITTKLFEDNITYEEYLVKYANNVD